jgi:hypothetical protein
LDLKKFPFDTEIVRIYVCILDISPSSNSKLRYKVSHAATEATRRVFRTRVRG